MKVAVSLVGFCGCYLIALAVIGESASILKEEVKGGSEESSSIQEAIGNRIKLLQNLYKKDKQLMSQRDEALDKIHRFYGPDTNPQVDYLIRSLFKLKTREKELMVKKEEETLFRQVLQVLDHHIEALKGLNEQDKEIMSKREEYLSSLPYYVPYNVIDMIENLDQEKELLREKEEAAERL